MYLELRSADAQSGSMSIGPAGTMDGVERRRVEEALNVLLDSLGASSAALRHNRPLISCCCASCGGLTFEFSHCHWTLDSGQINIKYSRDSDELRSHHHIAYRIRRRQIV
jgi:hypothetical protein